MITWERNVWTGIDLYRVNRNGRIKRISFNDGSHLYSAEHWGDFSLAFPVCRDVPWRKSLKQALEDLRILQEGES